MAGDRKTFPAGTRFGQWEVISETIQNRFHMSQSVCRCDCGTVSVVINANLREGKSSMCPKCRAKNNNPHLAKLSEDDVQAIRRAMRTDESAKDIAKRFNVTKSHILLIDRGLVWKDLQWPEGIEPRAEKQYRGKGLTLDQVTEIKRRLDADEKCCKVAIDFPMVSARTISAIKRGEVFRSVPWPDGSIR